MPFDVANFRTAILTRGVVKPNKFLVRPFSPPALAGAFGEVVRDMELWAESTELPMFGLESGSHPRYGYGPNEKRVTRSVYTDIRLILIADADSDHWRFFKEWLNLVVESNMSGGIRGSGGAAEPYELSYKADYLADLNIQVFDEMGNLSKSVNLRDSFPIAMESIRVNWADNQSYMRIPITFTFTDWYEDVISI